MLNPLNRFRQLHKWPDIAALVSDHAPVRARHGAHRMRGPRRAGGCIGQSTASGVRPETASSHRPPENAPARRAAGPRRIAAGDKSAHGIGVRGRFLHASGARHEETGDDS
ncbi:Adenosylhomocysteinase [Burkholderia cepacia]|nr:Adenosylhomocysteinase [Burkholderia cepacia]